MSRQKLTELILGDVNRPILRRGELLQVVGLDRGSIQHWEQSRYWSYSGPDTGRRLFSMAEAMKFAAAKYLTESGISALRAWDYINDKPNYFISDAGPAFLIVATNDSGHWVGCRSKDDVKVQISAQVARYLIPGGSRKSATCSVFDLGSIRNDVRKTIQDLFDAMPVEKLAMRATLLDSDEEEE